MNTEYDWLRLYKAAILETIGQRSKVTFKQRRVG